MSDPREDRRKRLEGTAANLEMVCEGDSQDARDIRSLLADEERLRKLLVAASTRVRHETLVSGLVVCQPGCLACELELRAELSAPPEEGSRG